MALAIYNGIPTPIPLSLAFYHFLLQSPVAEAPIMLNFGWEKLARQFNQNLEGLGLTFTFTFKGGDGQTYSADMIKRQDQNIFDIDGPFCDESEVEVTAQNQRSYVQYYTTWLLKKTVEPQLMAFVKGFSTILPPASLCMLTPGILYSLAMGEKVDVARLKRYARYESDYHEQHQTIIWFWQTLESMSNEQLRKFSRFVFANERLPLFAGKAVWFIIGPSGNDVEGVSPSMTPNTT